MGDLKLKNTGLRQLKKFHPWLRVTDITGGSDIPNRPSLVTIENQLWLCSPKSFLRFRRIGPESYFPGTQPRHPITNAAQAAELLRPWLTEHLHATLSQKLHLLNFNKDADDPCLRWIFAENDFIPGFVIDILGPHVVVQINTSPAEWLWPFFKETFSQAYQALFAQKPLWIEMRNSPSRLKEDLPILDRSQNVPSIILRWNGLRWNFQPGGSQKTGGYLDQKSNHVLAADYAQEFNYKTAWDLCCFEGGFSMHLLQKGLNVVAVDQSSAAISSANANVLLNKLEKKFLTETSDLFEFLDKKNPEPQVDIIVLDPPSFVKNTQNLTPALNAYKKLNVECLKRIHAGGLLVSCVCSHAVSRDMYKKLLMDAAKESFRKIEILKTTGPSLDHMPRKSFPEGDYLHAWFIKVTD